MRSASTWGVTSFCVDYLGKTPDYPYPTAMLRCVPGVIRIGSKLKRVFIVLFQQEN
jgi:hypothetical protein